MLKIHCPLCGSRTEEEFAYGGEAHVVRPPDPEAATDSEWTAYLYHRENHRGVQLERWCHSYGCGTWFNLARDTETHEILAVYPMGSAPPREVSQ